MIQPVARKLFTEEIPNVLLTFGSYPGSKKSSRGISVLLFSCWKEGLGELYGDNLKKLNTFLPYEHFKMEGLHCLKFLPEQNDFMCKIDLKDAYFAIFLSKKSSKYVRFKWPSNRYEFICLCFGLGLTAQVFIKLLKLE